MMIENSGVAYFFVPLTKLSQIERICMNISVLRNVRLARVLMSN